MKRLLKDPLLHFLVLGAVLFVVSFVRGDGGAEPADRIVIAESQVERLRDAAALMRGRSPSREELAEIIEPAIREEVLYREALALGLDVDDDEVRRRLVEKMQYLTENLADPEPPSEDALRGFFEERPELFAIPEAVTFEQVFFSPQMRGDGVDDDAAAALDALRDGADPATVGDRTPLSLRFDAAPRERVDVLFGAALTDAVFTMAPGGWHGPFRSDFGLHLVRLLDRSPPRMPDFDEARERVVEVYAEERRAERNAAEYARMRARYDVVVEWPAGPGGEETRSGSGIEETP